MLFYLIWQRWTFLIENFIPTPFFLFPIVTLTPDSEISFSLSIPVSSFFFFFLKPNSIGGNNFYHVSVLTSLFVKKYFFLILNWNFRYLSWLRHYQIGKFVLLKQCYYCANMGALKKKIKNGVFYHPQVRLRVIRQFVLVS